jgi:hypothetical protein
MEDLETIEQDVAIGQEDGQITVAKIMIRYNPAFIAKVLVDTLVDDVGIIIGNALATNLNKAEKESH